MDKHLREEELKLALRKLSEFKHIIHFEDNQINAFANLERLFTIELKEILSSNKNKK